MNARLAEDVFLESEFFDRAEHMREQLTAALGPAEDGILKQVSSPGAYSFLLAAAAQVFTQDLVFAFLNRLRRWATEKLSTHHVSTPQIHVYGAAHHRRLAPDAAQARWHYLFSLSRPPARVQLLGRTQMGSTRFGILLNSVSRIELASNHLLVHETSEAYAIPERAARSTESAILLHGYLW